MTPDRPIVYPPRVREIMDRYAAQADISVVAIIRGPQTQRAVCAKRRVAQELRAKGFSLNEIGRFLHRHHTSVLHLLNSGPPEPVRPDWHVWRDLPCPDLSGEWAI